MDVFQTLQGIDFEWDDAKAERNWQKHGVLFLTACEAFFDPFLVSLDDELIDGEERQSMIGMTQAWQVLYVVYVWRGDAIRLISARLATGYERKIYESGAA